MYLWGLNEVDIENGLLSVRHMGRYSMIVQSSFPFLLFPSGRTYTYRNLIEKVGLKS